MKTSRSNRRTRKLFKAKSLGHLRFTARRADVLVGARASKILSKNFKLARKTFFKNYKTFKTKKPSVVILRRDLKSKVFDRINKSIDDSSTKKTQQQCNNSSFLTCTPGTCRRKKKKKALSSVQRKRWVQPWRLDRRMEPILISVDTKSPEFDPY